MTSNLSERIGITEVGALACWVRSTAGRHFSVQFKYGAETAYVDSGGNMVIPALNAEMTIRDAIRLRGFCLHETSHPCYQPDIFKIMDKEKIPVTSPLAAVFNLLLDVHAETRRADEWPGDAKALSEFAVVVGADVHERLSTALAQPGAAKNLAITEDFGKIAACLTACRNAEATWNLGMQIGFVKVIDNLYTAEIRELADTIERKFNLTSTLVENAADIDEWGIWDLACQIFEFLWERPASEESNSKGGKSKSEKGEGEGESGTDSDSSDADGEKAEKGKGDGSEYGPGGDAEGNPGKGLIKVTEMLFSDHYDTAKGGGTGMGFDFTNYKQRDSYTPVDPATFKVIKYGSGKE